MVFLICYLHDKLFFMLLMWLLSERVVWNYGFKYVICIWLLSLDWTCLNDLYSLLIVHKSLKWHNLTKCPFLACVVVICAYGLMLSTCDVLTPFSHFPIQHTFRSLRFGSRRLRRRLGYSHNQTGRSSFSRGWCRYSIVGFA